MSWARIGKKLELELHTIANRHRRALEDLAKALNRKKSLPLS
jgi:DNA-directed RNA polymerase specialized sigma24 family protein